MTESRRSLLEPGEAARRLGLSVERVRQLADAGILPVMARTGRGIRLFDRAAIERFARRAARRAQRRAADSAAARRDGEAPDHARRVARADEAPATGGGR